MAGDMPPTWIGAVVFGLCAAGFLGFGLKLMSTDVHSPFGTVLILIAAGCAATAIRQVRARRRRG